MRDGVLSRLDAALGTGVERAVRVKHERRLAKLGWSHALEPPDDDMWAAGDPPPREGNSLEVLVDGAEALPRIAEALRSAQSFVHLTGWHVAPSFELERGVPASSIGHVLGEVSARIPVRVLVWSGAPVPVFPPSRSQVRKGIEQLARQTQIECHPDPREHPFHCHHEKTIVVDGRLAFVGGMDLTDLGGDRFDTSGHPARRRMGWHDVATVIRGPAVADVAAHFAQRWLEVKGERLPEVGQPAPAGASTVQVVRTVSEDMYRSVPHGDFRILESYIRALGSARRLIYLENQFLWSPEIVDVLAEKLRCPPSPDFRLVIMLPAKASNGQEDSRGQLGMLAAADDGAGRLLAATLQSRSGTRADPLYIHAKVGIVDDRWLTVGSANLNAHSLMNDTEMNVVTDDADLARHTRVRLWAEHLEADPAEVAAMEPAELVDRRWRPIATEQRRRSDQGLEPTHRLLTLPGVSRRSARLLGPLQNLVDDG